MTSSAALNGPAKVTSPSLSDESDSLTCLLRRLCVNNNHRKTTFSSSMTWQTYKCSQSRHLGLQSDQTEKTAPTSNKRPQVDLHPSGVICFFWTTTEKVLNRLVNSCSHVSGGISIAAAPAFGLGSSGRIWPLLTLGLLRCNELTARLRSEIPLPSCLSECDLFVFACIKAHAAKTRNRPPSLNTRRWQICINTQLHPRASWIFSFCCSGIWSHSLAIVAECGDTASGLRRRHV